MMRVTCGLIITICYGCSYHFVVVTVVFLFFLFCVEGKGLNSLNRYSIQNKLI